MTTDHQAQVDASREECHKARRKACSAWSNVMTGAHAILPNDLDAKCDKAQVSETVLREAIDRLAALASAPPAPAASEPVTETLAKVSIENFGKSPDAGPKRYSRADVEVLCAMAVAAYAKGVDLQPSAASSDALDARERLKQLDEVLLRELSTIQKIALAGEGCEIDAKDGFNEIAQRLGYLARSIPDLYRLTRAAIKGEQP